MPKQKKRRAPNLYALLKVDATASSAQIRKAYHALARKVHPDKCRDDPAAAENFRVDEGVHRLADLDRADEVYVLSTTNDLTPVRKVGYASFKADPSSPARRKLVRAMADCAAALG